MKTLIKALLLQVNARLQAPGISKAKVIKLNKLKNALQLALESEL